MKIHDSAVLGAGPAGLTAALYLARFGVSVALVEKSAPGGQMLNTAEIENYPGFPKGIAGWELTDLFSSHLGAYPVERVRGDVEHLALPSAPGEPYRLLFRGEERGIAARTVIAATGTGYRKLGVPGEERLLGKGVSYCAVCDGNFYRGQHVSVAGGGNSALEEALYLARITGKVSLIHRRESFRGNRHYLEKVAALPDKIELLTSHVIEEIRGDARLETLLLRHTDSGAVRELPVAGLFIYVGLEPRNAFLPPAVRRDPQGFIITDAEMGAGLDGFFAAGDIRSKNCPRSAAPSETEPQPRTRPFPTWSCSMRKSALVFLLLFLLSGCGVIDRFYLPPPDYTVQEIFEAANDAMRDRDYAKAARFYARVKDDYPFSPYAVEAELSLGDAYFLGEDYAQAAEAYRDFETLHPRHEAIPYALFQLGVSLRSGYISVDRAAWA